MLVRHQMCDPKAQEVAEGLLPNAGLANRQAPKKHAACQAESRRSRTQCKLAPNSSATKADMQHSSQGLEPGPTLDPFEGGTLASAWPTYFFFPGMGFALPLRVRALFFVRCPLSGKPWPQKTAAVLQYVRFS
jgi:hypothetical protein